MLKWLLFALLFNAPDLENAKRAYEKGATTKNSIEKNNEWNRSLNQLLIIKEQTPEKLSSLAILLAEFQEYELASYYLREALKEDPSNPLLRTQLEEVIRLGHLPQTLPEIRTDAINHLLLFPLLLITFALAFFYVRWPRLWLKWSLYLSLIPLAALGGVFLIKTYLSTIEGVLVQSSYLYQGPDEGYDLVSNEPLSGGMLVKVLDASKNGQFIKIQTADAIVGFVPEQVIRVLHY